MPTCLYYWDALSWENYYRTAVERSNKQKRKGEKSSPFSQYWNVSYDCYVSTFTADTLCHNSDYLLNYTTEIYKGLGGRTVKRMATSTESNGRLWRTETAIRWSSRKRNPQRSSRSRNTSRKWALRLRLLHVASMQASFDNSFSGSAEIQDSNASKTSSAFSGFSGFLLLFFPASHRIAIYHECPYLGVQGALSYFIACFLSPWPCLSVPTFGLTLAYVL